jgi:hypothetical protein
LTKKQAKGQRASWPLNDNEQRASRGKTRKKGLFIFQGLERFLKGFLKLNRERTKRKAEIEARANREELPKTGQGCFAIEQRANNGKMTKSAWIRAAVFSIEQRANREKNAKAGIMPGPSFYRPCRENAERN